MRRCHSRLVLGARRTFLRVLGIALTCVSALGHAAEVNVYNWAEYTAPDTISGFEKATGIKVNYSVYDSNDALQAWLLTGRAGFDIVVPSAHYAARHIQAGLYRKLDKARIPNLGYLDPVLMEMIAAIDPGNQYLVPWGYGTNGLGYNATRVRQLLGEEADLQSWDMLFKPENAEKLRACGISVLDEAAYVFPAVLRYMGKDPNSENIADYREALEVLKRIRPYIRQFSSSGYIDELASGELCMVYGYSGDVLIARSRAREAERAYAIEYHVPREGAPVGFDVMAVPRNAPNVDAAHSFINHITTPEVQAAITNATFYPNANLEGRRYVVKEVADDPMIYPNEEAAQMLFVVKPRSLRLQREMSRMWSELKSGR